MFNVPEQVHVQVILVTAGEKDSETARSDARKRAEEAAKRAAAGEDFAALAKQYSQDKSAARGGDLGLVPRGVMFPKFEEIAFSAKPGTVSPVFETPKGFNVIKILEKHPESTRTYEEVKAALMADMGRMMQQDIVKARVRSSRRPRRLPCSTRPSTSPPKHSSRLRRRQSLATFRIKGVLPSKTRSLVPVSKKWYVRVVASGRLGRLRALGGDGRERCIAELRWKRQLVATRLEQNAAGESDRLSDRSACRRC